MNPHIFRLVGEGLVIVTVMAAIVLMFERVGKKNGYFMSNKAKLITVLAGLGIAGLLNAGLFIDHDMVWSLRSFDFCFFLAFTPFCYGLWNQPKTPAVK